MDKILFIFLVKSFFQWASAQIRTFQFRKIKQKSAIKKFLNNSEQILTIKKYIKISIDLFCDKIKNFLQEKLIFFMVKMHFTN